jgi:hypothetical protein
MAPIRAHLQHDTGILTVDNKTVIPAGEILVRKQDCSYHLCYQQQNVNGLHHESPTKRITHLASVSRPTDTAKDSFGRPTGELENIIAMLPLVLTGKEILQAGDKAQSGIKWVLSFDTGAGLDLRKNDVLTTATVKATIISATEITDGILTITATTD